VPEESADLQSLLGEFLQRSGAHASAIVSRSGVPLAWALPQDAHVDNFGTMTATLFGALEVIYTGLHKPAPERIVVQSDGGILVAQALTPKAFLVAITPTESAEFSKAMAETATRARALLGASTVD